MALSSHSLRTPARAETSACQHIVQFYESDRFHCEAVSRFLGEGLLKGEIAVAFATQEHLLPVERAMLEAGIDVAAARSEGRLVLHDAREMLPRLMRNGEVDPALVGAILGLLVSDLRARNLKIRIYGEMVHLLWSEGNPRSTLALEQAWTELIRKHDFTLLCGYGIDGFRSEADRAGFQAVCNSHSHVLPSETYSELKDVDAQLRSVASLQQRARALEAEISERKRAEDELRHKTEELSRANEELQRFMYAASHDLKEPVRMVGIFLQMVQKRSLGTFDPEIAQLLRYAADGAHRTGEMVDDLLRHARVGLHSLPRKMVDCNQVLRSALSNLDEAIQSSGAKIAHGALPLVNGDPVQLIQLFQNLISNAIKFHEQGQPLVQIEVESSAEPAEWHFQVRDNGIGIDPKFQPRLFVLFNRLHTRERYPGSGIGLATCKKIVHSLGGKIWVESDGKRGSVFHFTIPVIKSPS